jgi:hypothetical protein
MVLGWFVFVISFILAVVLFAVYRRLYPVFYLVSIAFYVYTMGFMIDAFNFGRFGILSTLVISAVVFILAGYYLSSVVHLKVPGNNGN